MSMLDMEYFTTVAQDEQYGAQGQRSLRILQKMILVNCFWKYVHSLTYVCLTVLVKATREVSTPLCQLLVTVSLIILHFCGPLHTFRKKQCIEEMN